MGVNPDETPDCFVNSNLKIDLLDPIDKTSILAEKGTKYMFDGSVASVSQNKEAVFNVELDKIIPFCREGKSSCDLASEIAIQYTIYPITSRYKVLGAPSPDYFCKKAPCENKPENMRANFVEKGEVIVRTADFKVDEDLTTDRCKINNMELLEKTKNGREYYLFPPRPANPTKYNKNDACFKGSKAIPPEFLAMTGIERFSEDGKKGKAKCDDVKPECGGEGVPGLKGEKGLQGGKGYKPGIHRKNCGDGCFHGIPKGDKNDR